MNWYRGSDDGLARVANAANPVGGNGVNADPALKDANAANSLNATLSASEDFYANVRRDSRDMKSGKLTICANCGSENAPVMVERRERLPDVRLCVDCVPDECLHDGVSVRESFYREITMTVKDGVASV